MGGAEVSIRGQKASIIGTPDVNVTDRANRLLGIVYGNLSQLQQRPVTNELLIQLTSAGIQIDPRQIRNLLFATDSIDVSGSNVNATIPGTVDVSDRAARLLGITYGSQNQKLLQRAVTFDLQTQLRTNGTEYDARDRNWDLNFGTDQVDVSGSSVTVTNAPAIPINDFNTDINIGSGSSSTHTYTATGNFRLTLVEASASGAMKIEIKSGISGSETTKMVAFTTGSNLAIQLHFKEEIQLTAGQKILVIRTNREIQAMDIFSTILGFNV